MTKKQIHTIILQEQEIKILTRENKALTRAYSVLWKRNEKIRAENRRLLGRCNELDGVNA